MTFVHGKGTAVSLDAADLSIYANNVQFNRSVESHETTTFGRGSKTYAGGLKDGEGTIEGLYDNTASTGPAALFRGLISAAELVELVYAPEGDATGKPTDTVQVLVTAYEETAPVGDMITFSASLQFSGDVVTGTAT